MEQMKHTRDTHTQVSDRLLWTAAEEKSAGNSILKQVAWWVRFPGPLFVRKARSGWRRKKKQQKKKNGGHTVRRLSSLFHKYVRDEPFIRVKMAPSRRVFCFLDFSRLENVTSPHQGATTGSGPNKLTWRTRSCPSRKKKKKRRGSSFGGRGIILLNYSHYYYYYYTIRRYRFCFSCW